METNRQKEDGLTNKRMHNNSQGKGKWKWELHIQGE